MGNKILALLCLVFFFFVSVSCKKDEGNLEGNPEFAKKGGKFNYIDQLLVKGDTLWVISSDPSPFESFFIIIPPYQIAIRDLKDDHLIASTRDIPPVFYFNTDRNRIPYFTDWKKIYKLNSDLSYQEQLSIPGIARIDRISFDGNNNMWMGTSEGGLFFFNGKDTARFNKANSILSDNYVQFMATDSESTLWFMQGSSLYKVDRNRMITKDSFSLPFENRAGAIFISADRNDALWVTKWDGNNHRLLRKLKGSAWTEIAPPASSGRRPIKFIKSDNTGRIWVDYSNYPKDVLAYYEGNGWVEIQFSEAEININDIDVYKNDIIIGTTEGILRRPL